MEFCQRRHKTASNSKQRFRLYFQTAMRQVQFLALVKVSIQGKVSPHSAQRLFPPIALQNYLVSTDSYTGLVNKQNNI